MTAHAKALKFEGPVSGFDLSTAPNWSGTDSAYVEYRRVFDKCYIGYKSWSTCTKRGGYASAITDKVNRKTTSTSGGVDVITVGKNHTIGLTSNSGSVDLRLVPNTELEQFTV